MEEAYNELAKLVQEPDLRDAAVLLLANKMVCIRFREHLISIEFLQREVPCKITPPLPDCQNTLHSCSQTFYSHVGDVPNKPSSWLVVYRGLIRCDPC